nr:hypothetical protein [bacterium]
MLENNSDKLDIEKAIVETMAFFDIFNYPLTAFEIWKYLKIDLDYKEIFYSINKLIKKDILDKKNGFYFFKDRGCLVDIRKNRYFYTKRKIKIVKKWFKFFKFFINYEAIYIANVIGSNNLKDNGDIDLFIVSSHKKIWSTRFFLAFLGKFFNIRPKPGDEKDKLCFSFFIDEINLNLEKFKIDNDLYFIYWVTGLIPLELSDEKYFKKILKDNLWLKRYLPNYFKIFNLENLIEEDNLFGEDFFNLNFFQKIIKKIQLKIFPKEITDNANKSKTIIIKDNVLKLHVTDRREFFYKKYLEIIKNYETKI